MDGLNRPNIFGSMPLHVAASMQHTQAVHTLIELGAEMEPLNAAHETPLMLASRHGFGDIASALLASGQASPNRQDGAGWTALHHAVAFGHAGVMQLLLDNGANAHVRAAQGFRPIDFAVSQAVQGRGGTPGPLAAFLARGLVL